MESLKRIFKFRLNEANLHYSKWERTRMYLPMENVLGVLIHQYSETTESQMLGIINSIRLQVIERVYIYHYICM